MSDIAIKVENLSKLYQLGEVGTGTISHDLNRWWAKIQGKEDPFAKIGQTNDRSKKAESDFVWALKDINFEVKKGEVLGIIGRNGAGKSTLLKILSKITSPTTGKIYSKGRIASLLEVGTGFHPEMTGKENIYLNGAILGMRKWEIDKKFDEIVDFAGVEAYIDTPVKRYSSGMYVRLAFAVAAHLESETLIVDEVLAVGDAEFQKKCLGKMSDISKGDGRTILFVSHNMGSVKTLCNKSIVLKNGLVSFLGEVDKGIQVYVSESALKNINSHKDINGVCVSDLKFSNTKEDEVNFLYICKPFNIEGQVNFSKGIPEKVKIELYFRDIFGQILATLSTWMNSTSISPTSDKIIFKCEVKNGLNLTEGKYYVDINIILNSPIIFESIASFELMNDPKYSTFNMNIKPQLHGSVYTPHTWIIKHE